MTDFRPNDSDFGINPSNESNPPASRRRSLLKGLAIAGGVVSAATMRPSISKANQSQPATQGDIAVLSLLAAAELIEADLWQQYAELGGVTTGTQNPYQLALQNLDSDGSQYITSNTTDEQSHATFLNAYLASIGAEPVNLDKFRTLQGSQATGAADIGRLTNLMQLKVDTSWYTRYRSSMSPDFGATFPQALPALFAGQFAAIPQTDADFSNAAHIQAVANTAAFHFGAIEQAGSSLYAAMSQKVTSAEVLEITLGIGGDEICHFLEWVDFAGNGVQPPVAPLTDPTNGLTFPNFNVPANPLLQTNLIFPVPSQFINADLPVCSVIRPITSAGITATAAIKGLKSSGLFIGQPREFIDLLLSLAAKADAAQRFT
jgi:hypothetical protein